MNQVSRRIENECRREKLESETVSKGGKRSPFTMEAMKAQVKKPKAADMYGCIDYAPKVEDREHLESIKEELINASKTSEGRADKKTILDKMATTYALQREDITRPIRIDILQQQWPFLFYVSVLDLHFSKLVGKSAKDTLTSALQSKGPALLSLLEERARGNVMYVLYDIRRESRTAQSNQPAVAGVILALFAYFDEDCDTLFDCFGVSEELITIDNVLLYSSTSMLIRNLPGLYINVQDDPVVVEEVDTTQLAIHPCLIVCGEQ